MADAAKVRQIRLNIRQAKADMVNRLADALSGSLEASLLRHHCDKMFDVFEQAVGAEEAEQMVRRALVKAIRGKR